MLSNILIIIGAIVFFIAVIGVIYLIWYLLTMPFRLNKLENKAKIAKTPKEFAYVFWKLVDIQNSIGSEKVQVRCRGIHFILGKRSTELGLNKDIKDIVEK